MAEPPPARRGVPTPPRVGPAPRMIGSVMGRPFRWRRWLTHLGWGYAALISIWLALRGLASDRLWWLALLNTDALMLFVPLAALLALALWRRHTPLVMA